MKVATLENIFSTLGYSAITSEFITIPDIARINLVTDSALYRVADDSVKYYFDTSKGLLYRNTYNNAGDEIGITLILDVDKIVSVETRNAYSASEFTGHSY